MPTILTQHRRPLSLRAPCSPSNACKRARWHRAQPCQPARASSQDLAASATTQLLEAIQGTQRGLETAPEARQRIEEAIDKLEQQPSSGDLSGVWELAWTTESETPWQAAPLACMPCAAAAALVVCAWPCC